MLQEVGFFARLYATENPPIYVLNLWCFPIHLKEEVKSKDLRPFCAQGEETPGSHCVKKIGCLCLFLKHLL